MNFVFQICDNPNLFISALSMHELDKRNWHIFASATVSREKLFIPILVWEYQGQKLSP
jgi:hypothetical protein